MRQEKREEEEANETRKRRQDEKTGGKVGKTEQWKAEAARG